MRCGQDLLELWCCTYKYISIYPTLLFMNPYIYTMLTSFTVPAHSRHAQGNKYMTLQGGAVRCGAVWCGAKSIHSFIPPPLLTPHPSPPRRALAAAAAAVAAVQQLVSLMEKTLK